MDRFEEMLFASANQALEELKQQGAAEEDWEVDPISYLQLPREEDDPGINLDCRIRIYRKKMENKDLKFSFELRPGSGVGETIKQIISSEFREYKKNTSS